jgi:ABC-type transporter Mla subunit MlaD
MVDSEETSSRPRLPRWVIVLLVVIATVAVIAGVWYLAVWGFGREAVSSVGVAVHDLLA